MTKPEVEELAREIFIHKGLHEKMDGGAVGYLTPNECLASAEQFCDAVAVRRELPPVKD